MRRQYSAKAQQGAGVRENASEERTKLLREQKIQETARKLVESWKQCPVILASSAPYRRSVLYGMGFRSVESRPVPDSVENEIKRAEEERHHGGFYDSYKKGTPLLVAKAKVEELLSHGDIPDDAFICAADTMPMRFRTRRKDEEGDPLREPTRPIFVAEFLHKPADRLRAEEEILSTLRLLAEGMLHGQHLLHLADSEVDDDVADSMRSSVPKAHVLVFTGVAVRPPHQKDIRGFLSASFLFPRKIYSLVEHVNAVPGDDQLREIAREIIAAMLQSGTSPEKISGGIDWGNEEIRHLMDVRDFVPASDSSLVEEGVYRGLPKKALEAHLLRYAKEIVAPKSV